jgi:hypothetical protein
VSIDGPVGVSIKAMSEGCFHGQDIQRLTTCRALLRFSMRQKIDADADQDGGGPAAAVDVFFEEELAAMALVTSVSEAEAGATRLRFEVIQGEEQGEEGHCQEEDSGKEERAGDDGANGALHAGAGANVVEVADGLHGGCGEDFACGGVRTMAAIMVVATMGWDGWRRAGTIIAPPPARWESAGLESMTGEGLSVSDGPCA